MFPPAFARSLPSLCPAPFPPASEAGGLEGRDENQKVFELQPHILSWEAHVGLVLGKISGLTLDESTLRTLLRDPRGGWAVGPGGGGLGDVPGWGVVVACVCAWTRACAPRSADWVAASRDWTLLGRTRRW